MKRVRAKSWQELDSLPEGEWVEVVGGLDIEVTDATGQSGEERIVIPLKPSDARRLRPGKGEVLEARLHPKSVELVRRRRKRAART